MILVRTRQAVALKGMQIVKVLVSTEDLQRRLVHDTMTGERATDLLALARRVQVAGTLSRPPLLGLLTDALPSQGSISVKATT